MQVAARLCSWTHAIRSQCQTLLTCSEAFCLQIILEQTCTILLAPVGGGGLSKNLTNHLKSGLGRSPAPWLAIHWSGIFFPSKPTGTELLPASWREIKFLANIRSPPPSCYPVRLLCPFLRGLDPVRMTLPAGLPQPRPTSYTLMASWSGLCFPHLWTLWFGWRVTLSRRSSNPKPAGFLFVLLSVQLASFFPNSVSFTLFQIFYKIFALPAV